VNDNFIVVSDAYPSISAKVADLILPAAMIFEKWGAYGNAERRTQHLAPAGDAHREIHVDTWQTTSSRSGSPLPRSGRSGRSMTRHLPT